jgi:acyl phosphate:glycerol-3-phosphate acyltransferase
MLTSILLSLVSGYLLGALPFGYLVARAKGVNIMEVGSKNPGATNVLRVLGKGPGYLVFTLDALKGAVAALLPVLLHFSVNPEILGIAQVSGLVGALLGHSFSCFLKFRGGKGVATAAGAFLVLMPVSTLIAGAVWVLSFYSLRYVSLASMLAAAALPIAAAARGLPMVVVGVATGVAVFVILRHRANIIRLLNGTESKFVKKAKGADSTK